MAEIATRSRDIADAVRGKLAQTTRLLAIDGPGGSGKTSLAGAVAGWLVGAPVIHGDDFYRPMPEEERERLDAEAGYHRYFDWERLRDQVLAPVRIGRPARYRPYDWTTNQLGGDWREVPPGGFVIVEGVYTARPELAAFYHLTTYVDTPREICLQRQRDRGENSEEWIQRWRAAEDHYLRTTRPQSRVDRTVRGF